MILKIIVSSGELIIDFKNFKKLFPNIKLVWEHEKNETGFTIKQVHNSRKKKLR